MEDVLVPIVGMLIPISSIIGGIAIGAYAMYLRARARQMAHQERLVMIERGMVPPPEPVRDIPAAARWVRSGVIMTFLGLGLALMIGFSSDGNAVRQAIGVGGMLVLLGLGFFLIGYIETRRARALSNDPPTPSTTGF
jgi:hypothetical protein